jgi:hypothetical protein
MDGYTTAIYGSDQRADSITYSQIPYATEQGISKCVSGNFLEGTGKLGNLIKQRKRPFLARLFCVSLKAFGNWRAKFKAEPQPPGAQAALPSRRPKSHR